MQKKPSMRQLSWWYFSSFTILGMMLVPFTAQPQSSLDTIYHLHGTVIDGITGKPVAHALVTSTDRRLAAMTNTEGHFVVELSVPPRASAQGDGNPPLAGRLAGRYGMPGGRNTIQLLAQRPDFLPNTEPINLPLDDSLNTENVLLKLMRGGNIAGRVTAAGTDSTRGVRVELLRRQVLDGLYTWTQAGNAQVKADGTFRFTRLEPGAYSVMSAEWAGDQASRADPSSAHEQYPPDFLGDTPSFESATKLSLHYGEELQTALHLRAAAYFPVVVPVQNVPPSTPVSVRLVGVNTFNGFGLGWDTREGAVTGSLPSGSYTLLITSFGPHPAALSLPFTVTDHALQHGAVALAPGNDIPVRIHQDFSASSGTGAASPQAGFSSPSNRAEQPPLNLSLRPEDLGAINGGGMMRRRDDGSIVLANTQPGRYHVQANAVRGYIASLTSGNIDLLREPLAVGDSGSADPLDVTLRDDGATLSGTVDPGADTFAGHTSIFLLPTGGSGQTYQGYVFESGQFTMGNIAPGSYRLLALPAGRAAQQIPYRDATAMRAYNGVGTTLTLSAGQNASVQVSMTDVSKVAKEQ